MLYKKPKDPQKYSDNFIKLDAIERLRKKLF